MCTTGWARGRRRVSAAIAACLLGCLTLAAPATAQSRAQSDLESQAEVIATAGAARTVRITVTNLGPDEAYAGDDQFPEDDFKLYGFFSLFGADLLEAPASCENDPSLDNPPWADRRCMPTKAIAVGASITFVIRVRVANSSAKGSGIYASWTGERAYNGEGGTLEREASEDPNRANDIKTLYFNEAAPCVPKAKSPQKLSSKRLVVGVSAPKEAGCKAELTKVVLRIGKTVKFRLLQPRSKTLAAGESWTQYLNLGNRVTRALQAARKRGKNVTARAAFTLDGKSKTKEIVLR